MQGICRLSRRWHQQFCHSPSFGPHQQCFQSLGPSRGLRQARGQAKQVKSLRNDLDRTKLRPNSSQFPTLDDLSPAALLRPANNDMVVREYEQHGSDKSTLHRIKPDAELSDEVDKVWQELQEIDRQLEIAQQGPLGPQSEFWNQFPPNEREKILKALEVAREGEVPEDETDVLDLAEIDRLIEEDKADSSKSQTFAVSLGASPGHQALTKHFNKVLKDANEDKENSIKILRLWKWYVQCQRKIPGFSHSIPKRVWDFLWESQRDLQVKPQHLVRLGRDMLDSQIEMELRTWMQFTEALLSCGHLDEALSTWEDIEVDPEIRQDPKTVLRFYSIGIRIRGLLGQPAEAQSLAFSAIQKGAHPTILVQSIIAWAKGKTPGSTAKAWTVYLKLLALMGNKMTSSIYEEISTALLQSGEKDIALAVFKDLIRNLRGSGSNALGAYEHALGKISVGDDPQRIEDAINRVSLTMLLTLPKEFQNKYFFSSWIKKLIGENRVEAAAMVADLMYERGIRPDAIHLNGIIGAWLRDNSPEACRRAEDLATEMIQAKINHVAILSKQHEMQSPNNHFRKIFVSDNNGRVPQPSVQTNRFLPAANLETFSLMFDYYEKKRRWADFTTLAGTFFGPARLTPNIFIANKLLAAELYNAALDRFWAIYKNLASHLGPNIETFSLFWQASGLDKKQGQNFLYTIGREPRNEDDIVNTVHREHFAKLMDWMKDSPARTRNAALQDFDEAFYGEITKAFCKQLDLPGMICVMRGVYQVFDYAPTDAVLQLILVSVARALPRSKQTSSFRGGRRRVAQAELGVDQTNLKKIAEIVDTVGAELKLKRVEQDGVDPEKLEDMNSAEFKKLQIDVMTEFLMLMMHNLCTWDRRVIQKSVTTAADTMHVKLPSVRK